MAASIVLGFLNVPYSYDTVWTPMKSAKAEAERSRARSFKKTNSVQKVADHLEKKYHVLRMFTYLHGHEIAEDLRPLYARRMEVAMARGKWTEVHIPKTVAEKVERRFRKFLDQREMDGMMPGIPTEASKKGTSNWRSSKKNNPGRPSFIDTGLYRASFRVTEKNR